MDEYLEIRIEFEKDKGDPTRIFKTMADLIESTQRLDDHLASAIGSTVKTSLYLHDIEAASLKAKLKTVVEELPDEALKSGDVKKVIGHFLFKAKHKVIDWCSERNEITGRAEVKELESDLYKLANESDIKILPAYSTIETSTLLSDINSINDAIANLEENDRATYSTPEGISEFNSKLIVSNKVVSDIITRETIRSSGEKIIKVKKPDYLGTSQWSFKYSGRLIEAKIHDDDWLNEFQSRNANVQPGDSLRVELNEEVSYGYDNEVVSVHYEVLKVMEIIPAPKYIQGELL